MQNDTDHVSLMHLIPRKCGEFHYSISDEDYSYFLGLSNESLLKDLVELAYYTCMEFVILDIGIARWEEVFLSDSLCREKKRLNK